MISGGVFFSKASLYASEALVSNAAKIIYNGLYPVLSDAVNGGYVVDIHELFEAGTLDVASAYLFRRRE